MGKYMSVKEMGDLLGIRKTDRYWLLKKGYFNVIHKAGKMWVETKSFEKWYANQIKYHKVTGEEPGIEVRKTSYAPGEAAELLGVNEWVIYELIKNGRLKTYKLDGWMRIPKDHFHKWYESQDRYHLADQNSQDHRKRNARPDTVSDNPAEVISSGPGRAQKPGSGQDKADNDAARFNRSSPFIISSSGKEEYLTIGRACRIAGVSRQTMTSWYRKGKFPVIRSGKVVRIPLSELEKWLEQREYTRYTERSKNDGNNQKKRKSL